MICEEAVRVNKWYYIFRVTILRICERSSVQHLARWGAIISLHVISARTRSSRAYGHSESRWGTVAYTLYTNATSVTCTNGINCISHKGPNIIKYCKYCWIFRCEWVHSHTGGNLCMALIPSTMIRLTHYLITCQYLTHDNYWACRLVQTNEESIYKHIRDIVT